LRFIVFVSHSTLGLDSNKEEDLTAFLGERTADAQVLSPGHLWRDKWTARSGPLSLGTMDSALFRGGFIQ